MLMDIINKLKNVKLKPTKQRILLGKLLFDGKDKHFTADMVQKQVSDIGKSISLATIYNCLNKFVDLGLLKKIENKGEVSVFDTNILPHHHFLDEGTGEFIDIDPKEIKFFKLPNLPKGFNKTGLEVLIKIKKKNN